MDWKGGLVVKNSKFWNNKKLLVTGGTGFIGSHLLDNLINKRNLEKENIFVPDSKKNDLRLFENCQKK